MKKWTLKEWIPIISIIVSLASFITVFYKDFLTGAELKTVLSTIVVLKAAENNREAIAEQILLNDILSNKPSLEARQFILAKQEIAQAVKESNREKTLAEIIKYLNEISKEGKKITYNASLETLAPFFGDKNIALSFYIPLNIINIGRQTGDITTLILEIKSKTDPDAKWIYTCFSEIRPEEFMKIIPNQPMGTIIGKLFSGISIGPASNYRLDAHLFPMDIVKNRIISKTSLIPGKYSIQIIGYDSKNEKKLVSNIGELEISPIMLVNAFNGVNAVINLAAEGHIEKLLGSN